MNYKFDEERGTFTLYQPETGKDWSNHFFNGKSYILTVTHQGGTFSRYVDGDAVQVSLNAPHTSFVYVRDEESKRYWNISCYPSLNPVQNYVCTHGQQFTEISSSCEGIDGSIAYAVAPDDLYEVWEVHLTNRTDRERRLSLFATTGFDLNGYAQPVYYSAVTTSATEFVPEANAVFNRNLNPYRPHEWSSGFILSGERVATYDGNLEKFIGTMGTFTKPRVLEAGEDCTNSLATVRTRGGVLQSRLTLAPGESRTVYYLLGLTDRRETLVERYSELIAGAPGIVEAARNGQERFGNLRVRCPEPQIDHVLNFWAEHQVSYCMLGKKAVRDNAQLGMAMLNFNVPLAKKTIDECMAHQYADGHAVLTWYPYLEPNVYSDPSAWLIFAACEYVKESGDFGWLEQEVPFLDGGTATVYGHLTRAVEWFERPDNYGEHGLPRIHHADWNDALNIPDERAESVMMAMLIAKAYGEIAELARVTGDAALAERLPARKAELAERVNRTAFNGEYYVRAFSRFGVVGDRNDPNGGSIYVNPQSWAILSGIVPKDRLKSVLAAVDGMETEQGIPLCSPAYQRYDEHVGRMSGMLPGVYENGGVYNHAGCFKVMADCTLGRAEQALATLRKILPDGECNPSALTTTEPYVFTNCYLKHPAVDMQVGFAWQTGTSAWGLMCVYEGILGLKRGYDGLHVQPCLPADWKEVEARRVYRGSALHFRYENHGGREVALTVDGKPVAGSVVPLFHDGQPHEVVVTLK